MIEEDEACGRASWREEMSSQDTDAHRTRGFLVVGRVGVSLHLGVLISAARPDETEGQIADHRPADWFPPHGKAMRTS